MSRKSEIIDEFTENLHPVTAKTDMGFQYNINSQLLWILTVKNRITPTDSDGEYVETIQLLKTAIQNLEDLLINQVENDEKYSKTLEKAKYMESNIISLNDFVLASYRNKAERTEALNLGRANIKWNRHRAEKILEIENLKFRGLMLLMQKHNLLLEFDAKGII